MRTLILIIAGLLLAAATLRFVPPHLRMPGLVAFSLVWLGACAVNLRIGLSHGYTLAQELPIHVVLFGVPVLAAWAVSWWLRR